MTKGVVDVLEVVDIKEQNSDPLLGAGLDQLADPPVQVRVAVVDPQDPAAMLMPGFDGRTSAIAYGSRLVFDAIGLWPGDAVVWPLAAALVGLALLAMRTPTSKCIRAGCRYAHLGPRPL